MPHGGASPGLLGRSKGPLLSGIRAGPDQFIPHDDAKALESELREAGGCSTLSSTKLRTEPVTAFFNEGIRPGFGALRTQGRRAASSWGRTVQRPGRDQLTGNIRGRKAERA